MRIPKLPLLCVLGVAALTAIFAGRLTAQIPAATPPTPAASLPYATTPAFAGLTFSNPVAIVTPPGETNRLFIIEKVGRIAVIPNFAQPTREVFLDISEKVINGAGSSETGLLSLAFHPDYRNNRQFFVWYTSFSGGRGVSGEDRLARFRASPTNPNLADPTSEELLVSQTDEAGNHNGGHLLFGPDGYLYWSIGDEGGGNDTYQNSQRIDKDFFSGIHRLDVDRKPGNIDPTAHPSVHAGTYSIPRDNPFVGATQFNNTAIDPAKLRAEFWAVGLRNPWRMAFDASNGQLWVSDIGQNRNEEIDIIAKGGNYGWNYREAQGPGPRAAPTGVTFNEPIWDYPRSEGASITGGFVYRGTRYPDLVGQYIFADYGSGKVWALRPNGVNRVSPENVKQIAQVPSVASFGIDPRTGDILIASLGQGILRLVPAAASGSNPP